MHCAACGAGVSGERGRDWSVHHRRPRGMGGTSLVWVNLPANLVLLHGSGVQSCHGTVESERNTWRDRGFLLSANARLQADEVPILHAVLGLVLLDNEGGWVEVSGAGIFY